MIPANPNFLVKYTDTKSLVATSINPDMVGNNGLPNAWRPPLNAIRGTREYTAIEFTIIYFFASSIISEKSLLYSLSLKLTAIISIS